MSAIYNLEPPTKGKVVLKTTLGDIDVELWPKEAPKAVRNFVQLCLEDYYDGTIFHRVVKNFMVQGGDPTGTGMGGESIYGDSFKDEFHTRIKFSHRGLVACANENAPNSNGSQFFITLEACPHLDRKHTIFGKVVGDSIYNVAHFNELETNSEDRPLEPPSFLSSEVLWNPFEDIVPRSTKEERETAAAVRREQDADAKRREKKSQKKNLGLLSFGEEAGEEDEGAVADAANLRFQSAFDAAGADDPRLIKGGTELAEALAAKEAAEEAERKRVRASVRATLKSEVTPVRKPRRLCVALPTKSSPERIRTAGSLQNDPSSTQHVARLLKHTLQSEECISGNLHAYRNSSSDATLMHQAMHITARVACSSSREGHLITTEKAATAFERMQETGAEERQASGQVTSTSHSPEEPSADFAARMQATALAKRQAHGGGPESVEVWIGNPRTSLQRKQIIICVRSELQNVLAGGKAPEGNLAGNEEGNRKEKRPKKRSRLEDRQREALASGKIGPAAVNPSKVIALQDTSLMSEFERKRIEAKTRSKLVRAKGDNLAALIGFKKRLAQNKAGSAKPQAEPQNEATAAGDRGPGQDLNLPAAWRIDKFLDDYEDEGFDSLAQHKLKFDKEAAKRDAMAANFDDNYVIEDPLAARNEKWNAKDGAAKRSQRAWAAGHEGPLL